MLTPKFLIFLAVGTALMLIPLQIYSTWNRIAINKTIVAAIILTITGTIGTYLMGYLENGFHFGSRSFYGAVFIIPIAFLVVSKVINISYGQLMDMSAPAVCVMLVLMKVLCILEGCCVGRAMWVNSDGMEVCFPSQVTELINAFILVVLLLVMARKANCRGMIYPWFLVLYGSSRFILNFFRAKSNPFVWILPAGHFWSLVAILIGAIWLAAIQKRNRRDSCLNY